MEMIYKWYIKFSTMWYDIVQNSQNWTLSKLKK